ncbi:MAG: hypothetical protein IID61_08885 [SAR324 cluster bacterium]|nr:hypothetical protein [SAR324 cluster bacterium]
MRQLIKLSFITLAVVAFVWTAGSLHAMPVAGPPPGERDQIALDIGGFAGVITSYILTPHEQGGEVPPATFTTTTELRLNITLGTDTISVTQARWIRESNDEINWGFAEAPYQFGQFTWRPTDGLRVDAGSMVYLPWTDRAVQWEWFSAVGPIFPSGTYTGYIENSPGVDFSYTAADGIDVGAALFTYGAITGTTNSFTTTGLDVDGDGIADFQTAQTAQTIVPHLIYSAGPLALRFSYYLETITFTFDSWANDDEAANTLMVLDVKFGYDDAGSFVKFDYLAADGDSYGDPNSTISFTVSQNLGDNAVWLSYSANTAAGGVDGNDQSYMQVGYMLPIAAGSQQRFEFVTQDNSDSSATAINWVLFQSF